MAFPNWPPYSDDTGLGQDGTEVDEALLDLIESALETEIVSATNPAVTTKAIKDEVVTARGNLANLNARIGVIVDADGNVLSIAGQASQTDLTKVLGARNLLVNDDFRLWHRGDSSAPTGWTLSAGATIARTGTGLTDTEKKVGLYAAKVTRSSGTPTLSQAILASADYDQILDGDVLSFGAWVHASATSQARVYVDDGSGSKTYSKYHTGTPGWEFLNVDASSDDLIHTISAAATKLEFGLEIATGTSDVYIDGATCMFADFAPPAWIPCIVDPGKMWVHKIVGTPSTGDDQDVFLPSRPTILLAVHGACTTAPSGGTFDYDIRASADFSGTNSPIGGAGSLFNDGKKFGYLDLSGTTANYQYRCLPGTYLDDATTAAEQALWSADIDAVNSASDIWIFMRCLQYLSPIEMFRAHNRWGE